jgi:hypothetical protein
MLFEVGPDDDYPEIQADGMQNEELRLRAACKLACKIYGQPFLVDVAFGDLMVGKPEIVEAERVFAIGDAMLLDPVRPLTGAERVVVVSTLRGPRAS